MNITVIPHNDLKKPIVAAMYNSDALLYLISSDEDDNESITEGWHPPQRDTINYPYITYRIDWFKRPPLGFINATMLLDIWDTDGNGNSLATVENISTELTNIYDGTTLIDGLIVIRCRVSVDNWIYDENDMGHIHRQVQINMTTIDMYGT
jgi:hypothetical protein